MQKFQFGNVVVVDSNQIGVIVKSWGDGSHDVYARSFNGIGCYPASEIKHFIYDKELSVGEMGFYE